MFSLVKRVAKKEGEVLDEKILNQIVESAQGHARNALQILEQVLGADPEKRIILAKQFEDQQTQGIELCRALINRKTQWKDAAAILTGLKDQEAETIRRNVLGYCQAVLLNGRADTQVGYVLEQFITPFYDSGFPQLTLACFTVLCGNRE
jgi:hypothetical protein